MKFKIIDKSIDYFRRYTYEVGPVFTLMESELIQMFCKSFGFPHGDGIFAPGGSMSNMYGMVLARYNAVPNIKSKGCFNIKPLVAFTSEEVAQPYIYPKILQIDFKGFKFIFSPITALKRLPIGLELAPKI